MRTSAAGIACIKRFEGFSPIPYRCPAGHLTIGYGHVLRDEEIQLLDEAAAERLLIADLAHAEAAVCRLITRPLAQHQFDALVSFTYNLGAGALQRSRLRRQVNARADAQAAREFLRWVHAQGRRLPGLVARRRAEACIYFNNQYIN